MQYEISGSVLAGQITTSTWAVAPSRTWAWSRAIGGAGRGIGGLASSRRGPGRLSSGPRPGRRQRWPGPRYPPGVQLCGGPAQGAPWAKAAVDRAWARRGPGRLSSRRRPGRWLRRGPGRLSSRRSPGRRQRWPGPRYPPRRSTLQWTCPGRALGEGSGRSGLGGGSVEDQGGSARGVRLGGGSGGPGHGTLPGVQLCSGPAQGAPWAKAAVDRAWAVAPSRTRA